jgi:hypothetical protein
VHHLDRNIAVANTGLEVLMTTISGSPRAITGCTVTRLPPDQARAIGWALIEAAGFLEAAVDQQSA